MDEIDEARWTEAADLLDRAGEALAECRLDEAQGLAESARDALAAVLGVDHPDHANALDTLGAIAAAQGNPEAAVVQFRAALAIYDACATDEEDAAVVRPLRAETLANLGEQLMRAGHADEAEPLVRAALTEAARAYGPDALEVSRFHNQLGVFLRFGGRYDEAEAAYLRAAALRDANGEPQPSTHFHNLSGLASARGDFVRAEGFARAAVAISEIRPLDGLSLGTDLCGLGDALAGQARFADAEAAYRRGLSLFAASGRADHPEVAYALHNLGDCLAALGQTVDAERAYRASIERKQAAFGADHPEIAATLSNLAALYAETNRMDAARVTSRRAVVMAQATLPPDAPIRQGVEAFARSLRRAPAGRRP
ncbi:MAG: tetratricopeptide repeat protein [Pseudomonadota bacterium]|nr:tetratricopeptide repeat protein [Pseudomonadota bacterium]